MIEEIAQKLISYPTLTPLECGIYEYIHELLEGFEYERMDCGEVKNAFFYQKFSPSATLHLCFAGHVDVVPAGEGWESDPFVGEIKSGALYGRGAQDMKGGIAAFLWAILQAKKEGIKGDFALSVLLTSDEEGKGVDGTRYVLERLAKEGRLPDFALVAEPTSEISVADTIKIGRRGSIHGVLKICGVQGHVAYPHQCINPVELLGAKLGEIAGKDLDGGDEYFQPSKIVVTSVQGGMQVSNVTPSELVIKFNVRNNQATNLEDVRAYFQELLQSLPYELELTCSALPFITNHHHPKITQLIECIQRVVGKTPKLGTAGGTSDARFFAPYGIGVAELGVCNDTIHAKNERVKLQELRDLAEIFKAFIQSLSKEEK